MNALNTLLPVFFMLGLGAVSRIAGWITPEQKNGADAVVFRILFPILIFQLMCTADFNLSHLSVIAYVFLAFAAAGLIGRLTVGFTGRKFAHISPYLVTVTEGGNVALPLYLSIVGNSSTTVIFDIAGSIMCFIIFPILVAKQAAMGTSSREILHTICTNSFVIAVAAGLLLNLTGIYTLIAGSPAGGIVTGIFDKATAPIVSMILFILGYNLKTDRDMIQPVLRLILVKTAFYALVIAGFFLFFPSRMADPVFRLAPFIYFMSPTGFGLVPIITPLFRNEEDASLTSAFISTYLLVTLSVYTVAVIFA